MPSGTDYIPLRKALKDYLREQGIALSDLLSLMDDEKKGLMEALRKRVHLTESQSRMLEKALTSRDLNLLLFVVQAFYGLNHSGLYKGFIIEPTREEVMWGNKATFEGCKMILRALQVSTNGLDD
ncbi:hypothetical protein KEJ18_00975 [Candidatus Bathyarchaeota archaeon]|nr:hypothetical protein [Candidatus Bathyarchaeota archaeon]